MEELSGTSKDILKDNISKLQRIFPEAFEDNNKINFEKLQELLGNDVDNSQERYDFTWNGKKQAIKISNTPTMATLRPNKEKSENWGGTDNLYIEGDNLEVLKLLQKSYTEKIKVIYIDPPYNTGHDFIYKDDFSNGIDNYLEQTAQVDSNGNQLQTNMESNGRFHTDWLNMMYPRLRLARNLLTQDGAIFISIDDNEYVNLKKMCDEIFGEVNFEGTFIVKSTPNARDYGHIGKMHEYILFYSKNSELLKTHALEDKNKRFKYCDERGKYNIHPLYNSNESFTNENRPNLFYPFFVDVNSKNSDGFYNISLTKSKKYTKPVYPPKSQKNNVQFVWRWGKEKSQKYINEEIMGANINGEYKIVQKMRNTKKIIRSIIEGKDVTSRKGTAEVESLMNGKIFSFPKPVELIKLLLSTESDDDSLILDFFSGSSTTADAVMQLNVEDNGNRKYIMVQLPEKTSEHSVAFKDGYKTIPKIAEERIRRSGKKIKYNHPDANIDTGFKVFTLDKSNIRRWNTSPDKLVEQLNLISNFVDGRSMDDVVYELLLKQGLPLTSKIEKIQLNNCDLFVINEGKLFIALGNGIDADVAKNIIHYDNDNDKGEISVIFQDQGFANDADKLNTLETLKSNGFKEENVFSV